MKELKGTRYRQIDMKILNLFFDYLELIFEVSPETLQDFEVKMIKEFEKTSTG